MHDYSLDLFVSDEGDILQHELNASYLYNSAHQSWIHCGHRLKITATLRRDAASQSPSFEDQSVVYISLNPSLGVAIRIMPVDTMSYPLVEFCQAKKLFTVTICQARIRQALLPTRYTYDPSAVQHGNLCIACMMTFLESFSSLRDPSRRTLCGSADDHPLIVPITLQHVYENHDDLWRIPSRSTLCGCYANLSGYLSRSPPQLSQVSLYA